jgi:hypothetical protein
VGLLALSLVNGTFEDESNRLPNADAAVPVEPLLATSTPALSPPAASPPAASSSMPDQGTSSPPTPSPSDSASPAPAPARSWGTPRRLDSTGGSVVARCYGADAYLMYWSPAPGYHAEDVTRGPAATARLQFEGVGEYQLTIQCVNGVPQLKVRGEPYDDRYRHH